MLSRMYILFLYFCYKYIYYIYKWLNHALQGCNKTPQIKVTNCYNFTGMAQPRHSLKKILLQILLQYIKVPLLLAYHLYTLFSFAYNYCSQLFRNISFQGKILYTRIQEHILQIALYL